MKKNVLTILMSAAAAATLISCSSNPSDYVPALPKATPQDKPKFSDPRATITGPDVEGTWKSSCNLSSKDRQTYRIFEITFKGEEVQKKTTLFNDSDCQEQASMTDENGLFRFVDKFTNDMYVVEYAFKLKDINGSYAGMENLKLEDQKIYIGDNASGEYFGVLRNEPLHKVTSETPDQGSEEENGVAVIATTYAEAKYALCNAQGRVIIMDLTKLDLTTSSEGLSRGAYQNCDDAKPGTWTDYEFKTRVSVENGYPQIKIALGPNDRIETYSSGSGLNKTGVPSGAYGVLTGNSGPCVFLKNAGDISAAYPVCN